ncbi:MAG: InlB B-repeat-containing protein [Tannerella sp.]|nr:InlB B-repeat-containing protein [Tannerella sp.]
MNEYAILIPIGSKIPSQPLPQGLVNGSSFGGWYTEANGHGNKWNFDSDIATQDMLLWALWVFEVTFDSQGGSPVATVTDVQGQLIPEPLDPTKSGLTFAGWYTNQMYTTAWDFATDRVTQNMTLYAKWTANVTFDSQGGSTVSSITGVQGLLIPEPAIPTKSGLNFAGWHTDLSYTTKWNFATDLFTQEMTLYAKWDPIPYTITLPVRQNFRITGAGNEIITQLDTSIMFGNAFVFKIEPEPGYSQSTPVVKAGGVQLTPDASGFYRIDPVTQPFAITVTGIVINKYAVSFDSQGGTIVGSLADVLHGSNISQPADPTKTGYTFAGWYTDALYSKAWDFATDLIIQDITLYAKWTKIDVPPSYISRVVYITAIEGATMKEYLPGAYQITSGDDFTFTLIPGSTNAHLIPVLKTGRKLTGGEEALGVTWERVKNADGSYSITIKRIQETVTVSIEFVNDDTSNEITKGTHVWAANGNIYMTATHNGNAAIYHISGSLVTTIPVRAGETSSIPLAPGYYVVVLNRTAYKVITGK